jgi:hypothetical protein
MEKRICYILIIILFIFSCRVEYIWLHDVKTENDLKKDTDSCIELIIEQEQGKKHTEKFINNRMNICLMLKGWKRVRKSE